MLQLVEVDEQQSDAALGGDAALEGLRQLAQGQHAVGQSGERVVGRLARQLVLHLFGLGDVAGDRRVVRDRAVLVAHDLQHDRHRAHDAVRAAEGELALPAVRRGCRDHLARHLVADRLDEQLRCCIPRRRRGRDADEVSCAVVAELESPVGVEHDHGVVRGVEDADEALAQHALGDRLGDVDGGAHESRVLTAHDDRLGRHVHPDGLAVGAHQLEFMRKRRRHLAGALPCILGRRAIRGRRVHPRRGTGSEGRTTEGELAERVVGCRQATVQVGLEHPDREGSN